MTGYCFDIVRKNDPDRFLLSLMVGAKYRPALWALFAFNYEIAKTREVVSETQIGLIRLQWWREAIGEIYDGGVVREHEVVRAIAESIRQYDLSREDFDHLVYAREFDLEGRAPSTLEGMFSYCDFTTTPLYRLVLKILGESADESILKAVSVHYAVIGLLRAVPFMRTERRVMLPVDILERKGTSVQKILDFNEKEKVVQAVIEVIERENKFRYGVATPKSRFLKAALAMATIYANQIASVQHDVFDPRLNLPPPMMALRVWIKSIF